MLYDLLFGLAFAGAIFFIAGALYEIAIERDEDGLILLLPAVVWFFVFGFIPVAVTFGHANNLAVISTQQNFITIQEERIASLTERIASFDYPSGSLLDADSPVRSIVESLADAENELAEAKKAKAEAIKGVESARIGPMSGVIRWYGDYK